MIRYPLAYSFRLPRRHRWRLAAALTLALGLAAGQAGADGTPFGIHAVGATLTYSIRITGQKNTGNARHSVWSKASVDRRLEATLHLTGQQDDLARVDNLEEQVARTARARQAMAADLPTMQKIADECSDDEACFTARMMNVMQGMSAQKREALRSATRGPAARISRHSLGHWNLDGKTRCSIHASTRGSYSFREADAGEGYVEYVTGSKERHGQADEDCRHDPVPNAYAKWDGDTGRLELQLPGISVAEQWKDQDGKTGSYEVVIPDTTLDHLQWSGKGPKSGQETRKVSIRTGDGDLPGTLTLRWTFAPNRT